MLRAKPRWESEALTGRLMALLLAFRRLDQLAAFSPAETEARNVDTNDSQTYKVVMNHEEQYSIWPSDRDNARGWMDAGKSGTRQECLDFIKSVWTDMRPLSLRKAME